MPREVLDAFLEERRVKMLPEQDSPLDFLTAVYQNEDLPLAVRMRAAIECAPYRHPKLTATAILSDEDFSVRLERAIARSAKVINGTLALPPGEGQEEP
jgi:hypothetical protein